MAMIYSVEDDASIRELILYALRQAGYEAEGFEEGTALMKALSGSVPDLILLDLMLPGEDGITLLRRIRNDARVRSVPVILLTAKGAEMDKVTGLDNGADDYIVKPFGVLELLSRVKAVLRRTGQPAENAPVQLGDIALDPARRSVTIAGREAVLTRKEFDLLEVLMRNKGLVLTREKLLDAVWGIDFPGDTRTVDVHVGTLRQKLGSAGALVQTVRGVGYRMEE
jgi:two-component system alkaline phosphatase synthesis response regulator PhoP